MRWSAWTMAVALVAALSLGVAACGSSGGGGTSNEQPEDRQPEPHTSLN